MVYKWLEDLYDTLLYVGFLLMLLFFFLFYWKEEYQTRHAEVVLQEFLDTAAVTGKISVEEYEGLLQRLKDIDSDYELEITCRENFLKPIYALISEEQLKQYYMNRNIREEAAFKAYEVEVEQEREELLCLQTETNESILAAENNEYLPLPPEDVIFTIEAVRPRQEVYIGENLITLCLIMSEEGVFYAEAAPVTAESSGKILLELTIKNVTYKIPVEVECHPRKIVCENGHTIVNSHDILEERKQTGNTNCPYCRMFPEIITCTQSVICKKTGAELTAEDVGINVQYMNGGTEYLTPESEEWQDNYDSNYCGIQNVIIRYRGVEDSVTVVSENEVCNQCANACNERSYTDYMRFSYCVECMSRVPLFTGETYLEEEIKMTKEIVSTLDVAGEIILKRGDFIALYLSKRGYETMLQKEVKKNGISG